MGLVAVDTACTYKRSDEWRSSGYAQEWHTPSQDAPVDKTRVAPKAPSMEDSAVGDRVLRVKSIYEFCDGDSGDEIMNDTSIWKAQLTRSVLLQSRLVEQRVEHRAATAKPLSCYPELRVRIVRRWRPQLWSDDMTRFCVEAGSLGDCARAFHEASRDEEVCVEHPWQCARGPPDLLGSPRAWNIHSTKNGHWRRVEHCTTEVG